MLKICIKRPITLMIISIKMLLSLIIAYFIDFRVFFSKFRNTVDISYIDNFEAKKFRTCMMHMTTSRGRAKLQS